MNDEIRRYVDERMKRCEEMYGITVIAWFLRDRGMPRKNSDLDFVFLFKNKDNEKCKAIHDIIGYGFDFWGWDICDAFETIMRSHDNFYINPNAEIKDIYLSGEHKRSGLGYFGGIFWMVGNPEVGGNAEFLTNGVRLLDELMEKKIIVNYLVAPLKERIDKINYTNGMSSYEYLNTLWRLAVAKNILLGGEPGETDFPTLIHQFADGEILSVINSLMSVYKGALSKYSQRFTINSLNAYICAEYESIVLEMIELLPEKEEKSMSILESLKELVKGI